MEYVLYGIVIFLLINGVVSVILQKYGLTKYTYDERFKKDVHGRILEMDKG